MIVKLLTTAIVVACVAATAAQPIPDSPDQVAAVAKFKDSDSPTPRAGWTAWSTGRKGRQRRSGRQLSSSPPPVEFVKPASVSFVKSEDAKLLTKAKRYADQAVTAAGNVGKSNSDPAGSASAKTASDGSTATAPGEKKMEWSLILLVVLLGLAIAAAIAVAQLRNRNPIPGHPVGDIHGVQMAMAMLPPNDDKGCVSFFVPLQGGGYASRQQSWGGHPQTPQPAPANPATPASGSTTFINNNYGSSPPPIGTLEPNPEPAPVPGV